MKTKPTTPGLSATLARIAPVLGKLFPNRFPNITAGKSDMRETIDALGALADTAEQKKVYNFSAAPAKQVIHLTEPGSKPLGTRAKAAVDAQIAELQKLSAQLPFNKPTSAPGGAIAALKAIKDPVQRTLHYRANQTAIDAEYRALEAAEEAATL